MTTVNFQYLLSQLAKHVRQDRQGKGDSPTTPAILNAAYNLCDYLELSDQEFGRVTLKDLNKGHQALSDAVRELLRVAKPRPGLADEQLEKVKMNLLAPARAPEWDVGNHYHRVRFGGVVMKLKATGDPGLWARYAGVAVPVMTEWIVIGEDPAPE